MGHTILVVEDDEDIRSLTELILTKAGHVVLPAESGEAGLRLLGEHPVELLLLDIMLPGIDGWEVCRRLRGDPRWAHLPILAFTVCNARHDQGDWHLVDTTVHKPFDRNTLLEAVARLLPCPLT